MAITRVNSASITNTTSGTTSCTATVPAGTGIQAGDLIIVCAGSQTGHTANGISVQDSVNATSYTTILETQLGSASSRWMQTFAYVTPQAIPDGSTFTVTGYATAANTECSIDVFRGATSTISRAAAGSSNASGTSSAAPALSSAPPAGDLVLTFCEDGSGTLTPGSPFTAGSSGTTGASTAIGYVAGADGSSTYGSTWTLGTANTSAAQTVSFAAVSAAVIPAARPGRTWLRQFRHRQQALASPPAAQAPVTGPPVYPLGRPVQARALPLRGGRTASRDGTYGQAGPPVRQPDGPVRTQPAVPFLPGRADTRSGPYGGTGPAVRPLDGPVRAQPARPFLSGRTAGRDGAYGGAGPAVRALHGPVRITPAPPLRGRIQARAGTFTSTAVTSGPPVRPLSGPVQARRLPARGGSVQSRSGTFTGVVITSGPPVYPLHGPVRTRPQPPPRGRIVKAAGVRAETGPAARQWHAPVGVARQQPPPPTRGRTASARGPAGVTGPPVIRLRKPVRGQAATPLLTGRAIWHAGIYTAPFVPPFTVGSLTAATTTGAATATTTAAALTAATTGQAALTASTAGGIDAYNAVYGPVYGPAGGTLTTSTSTATITTKTGP